MSFLSDSLASLFYIGKKLVKWYAVGLFSIIAFGWFVLHVL